MDGDLVMGKGGRDITDRMVRATITTMVTVCHEQLPEPRYPVNVELKEMAQGLVKKYPQFKDDYDLNPDRPWVSFLQVTVHIYKIISSYESTR